LKTGAAEGLQKIIQRRQLEGGDGLPVVRVVKTIAGSCTSRLSTSRPESSGRLM